jgi:hypothetical protein
MVTIHNKTFVDGVWYVECVVELASGTRSGTESVSAPEDATEQDLSEAILLAYQ